MENLTVAQLREKAKELGIKGVSGMKKDELIKLICENEKPDEEPKKQLFDINKSKKNVDGILEVLADGYGFARGANCLDGNSDIYVSPALIRKYYLKTKW